MLDFNILYAIGVAVALIVLLRFIFPLYKDRTNVYNDVKMGLLMFGYAFRDDKVKQITDRILGIVTMIEKMDKASWDKKQEALEIAFTELMDELGVVLDIGALELIIDIAVSYLPPTNPELK